MYPGRSSHVSDPNLNDAIEPDKSVDDELDIVEGAGEVDECDAAEAEAGEPAEEAAVHVEDDDEAAADEADEEEAEPVDPVEALREELRTLPGEWYVIHTYA